MGLPAAPIWRPNWRTLNRRLGLPPRPGRNGRLRADAFRLGDRAGAGRPQPRHQPARRLGGGLSRHAGRGVCRERRQRARREDRRAKVFHRECLAHQLRLRETLYGRRYRGRRRGHAWSGRPGRWWSALEELERGADSARDLRGRRDRRANCIATATGVPARCSARRWARSRPHCSTSWARRWACRCSSSWAANSREHVDCYANHWFFGATTPRGMCRQGARRWRWATRR